MNRLQLAWNILSIISTLAIIPLLFKILLSWRGILPVIYHLGKALAESKIAIFATGNNLTTFKNTIENSPLLKNTVVREISEKRDLSSAEQSSLYLVCWDDWKNDIDDIISSKKINQVPLIVYAPPRKVPLEMMAKLDEQPNTTLTNFRGRLINDIVISLIAGNQKK